LRIEGIGDPSFDRHLSQERRYPAHYSCGDKSLSDACNFSYEGGKFRVVPLLFLLDMLQDACDTFAFLSHKFQFEIGRSVSVDISNDARIS
jgi:hypothetical protein